MSAFSTSKPWSAKADGRSVSSNTSDNTARDAQAVLADAIRAARLGGAVDRAAFGTVEPHQASLKSSHQDWNPVTEVDRRSEEAIVAFLAQAYPHHSFLGEENVAGQEHEAEHL